MSFRSSNRKCVCCDKSGNNCGNKCNDKSGIRCVKSKKVLSELANYFPTKNITSGVDACYKCIILAKWAGINQSANNNNNDNHTYNLNENENQLTSEFNNSLNIGKSYFLIINFL